MSYRVVVADEAERDLDEAFLWYQMQLPSLGYHFIDAIRDSFNKLIQNPTLYRVIYKGIRRIIINKFPFGIYYVVDAQNKLIKIIAILHFKRNPKILKTRINK